MKQNNIDSWFVTGFADAESCFTFSVGLCPRNNKMKAGWQVNQSFQITLHQKDKALLELIKSNFGNIGYITSEIKDSLQYQISSLKDLTNVIIPHFERYPLITQKRADFELFKMVVEIMNRKEHLTNEGLQKIVNIRAIINKGLSD